MIPREFDAITKTDIEALVTNAVAERRTLEYKQQLPGDSDEEKRDFLADISSFANASGGDVIYGVSDKRDDNKPTGIPESIVGLPAVNTDLQIRRLEEIIRSSIEPRIPGVRIKPIPGFDDAPVLLIRIPKSWASPHMVIFKNLSRFYSRTSAGKYQLNVTEIRSAFAASGDLRTKITTFRADRLGKIVANETVVSLPASPKLILHLVPLSILNPDYQADLQPLTNDPNLSAPIQNRSSYNNRYNIDGFVSFNYSRAGGSSPGYCQVFRSGAIEAVDAEVFDQSNVANLIASLSVERMLIETTERYLGAMKKIGVPTPIIIMAAAFGLKGYGMATASYLHNRHPAHTIDRDALLFPDVLLEDYNTPGDILLKPIFDAFWQSAGFESCQHYNSQGRWDVSTQR
ncbi:MAG TPA: ATP-binding protein [Pseudomonadales bacterium]|nr:ATP-binding protein [Pseudomonadales bacterium]